MNPLDKDEKQSALFGIFRRHYNSLVTLTRTCVNTIADKLYSKSLISDDVLGQIITGHDADGTKASKLLYSVKQKLEVDPGKLRTLVEILREETVFDDLTKGIMSE